MHCWPSVHWGGILHTSMSVHSSVGGALTEVGGQGLPGKDTQESSVKNYIIHPAGLSIMNVNEQIRLGTH